MTQKLQLRISGMDCADCAHKLEKGVANLNGVADCQIDFVTTQMRVTGQADKATIVKRIQALGYDVAEADEPYHPTSKPQQLINLLRQPRNTLTVIGAAFIGVALIGQWITGIQYPGLFFIGGVCGLYFPARAGWAALRGKQGLDINVLMTLAAVGAFIIGEYAEAATVIVLFSLGEALEGYTIEQARDSIRSLTQLAPSEATLLAPCMDCQGCRGRPLPDGSGIYESGPCPWCAPHEQQVPVKSLAVGDQIIVKPGERIPMDGQVLKGHSAVNQAPITGESIPVAKEVGADVFAGTINGDGVLEIGVTRIAADNTLSRLIHLIEEAQAQKTPAQRFVDKFARTYTPTVVIGAILMAIIPPLLFGQPFLDPPQADGGHGWLYRALTLLVIACPCALVLATPVAVVSAISAAARRGVLIKGGAYLEMLGRIKVVAFDKTGTLTQGQPALVDLGCVDNCCSDTRRRDLLAACQHCDEMLAKAAAVERYSTHPLAQVITAAAASRAVSSLTAEAITSLPGQGIQGRVGQQQVTIGSHALLHRDQRHMANFYNRVSKAEANGHTTMLVCENNSIQGYLAVSDPPRHTSQATLVKLKEIGLTKTVMLTGDNKTVATAIGHQIGIDEIRPELMPEDKVSIIRALVNQHGDTVAMVGDGVNDAPALAAASVGIAMGASGTAQALETADVALMADDLIQLPAAIQLGRRAIQTIRFNIWFALIIKALFLLAALFGLATLWMAVLADMGTSLLVTLNGMRLIK